MNRITTSDDDGLPVKAERWEEEKKNWREVSKEEWDKAYNRIWDEACNSPWHC